MRFTSKKDRNFVIIRYKLKNWWDLLSGYRPCFDRFFAKKSKITGFWDCAE
jgi:hypothetical protein